MIASVLSMFPSPPSAMSADTGSRRSQLIARILWRKRAEQLIPAVAQDLREKGGPTYRCSPARTPTDSAPAGSRTAALPQVQEGADWIGGGNQFRKSQGAGPSDSKSCRRL